MKAFFQQNITFIKLYFYFKILDKFFSPANSTHITTVQCTPHTHNSVPAESSICSFIDLFNYYLFFLICNEFGSLVSKCCLRKWKCHSVWRLAFLFGLWAICKGVATCRVRPSSSWEWKPIGTSNNGDELWIYLFFIHEILQTKCYNL